MMDGFRDWMFNNGMSIPILDMIAGDWEQAGKGLANNAVTLGNMYGASQGMPMSIGKPFDNDPNTPIMQGKKSGFEQLWSGAATAGAGAMGGAGGAGGGMGGALGQGGSMGGTDPSSGFQMSPQMFSSILGGGQKGQQQPQQQNPMGAMPRISVSGQIMPQSPIGGSPYADWRKDITDDLARKERMKRPMMFGGF